MPQFSPNILPAPLPAPAPASLGAQTADIKRLQRLAKILEGTAGDPPAGQMVSGWYVPTSPLSHLASALGTAGSAGLGAMAEEKELALERSKAARLSEILGMSGDEKMQALAGSGIPEFQKAALEKSLKAPVANIPKLLKFPEGEENVTQFIDPVTGDVQREVRAPRMQPMMISPYQEASLGMQAQSQERADQALGLQAAAQARADMSLQAQLGAQQRDYELKLEKELTRKQELAEAPKRAAETARLKTKVEAQANIAERIDTTLPDIDRMEELLKGGRVRVGPVVGLAPTLTDETAEFEQLATNLQIAKSTLLKGSTSDRDFAKAIAATVGEKYSTKVNLEALKRMRAEIARVAKRHGVPIGQPAAVGAAVPMTPIPAPAGAASPVTDPEYQRLLELRSKYGR